MLTWPQGRRRLTALKACLAGLEDSEAPQKVRQCFLKAAKEAGVFVKEGEIFPRPGA